MKKNYLVLFREPDGREEAHLPEEIRVHREKWTEWLSKLRESDVLVSGNSLTLNGAVIKRETNTWLEIPHPYQVHEKEIVGGFLIITAPDLFEASEILKECPIYDFNGFTEIREIQQ
jgi:hypothetical protein